MKQIVFIGYGGHARSVADIALANGYNKLVFVDENARLNETCFTFPVIKNIPVQFDACFAAAGDNYRRQQQIVFAEENAWHLISIVSPHSYSGFGVEIEKACFVGNYAHLGPNSLIGKGCIINTGAVVEHDCCVGEFSHISVNSTLAGRVKIGRRVFVGAGAVIKDGVTITDDIVIGAGATVINDLTIAGVYVGTPAKLVKTRI